jgi:beta-barrel assembly-enhancing protease
MKMKQQKQWWIVLMITVFFSTSCSEGGGVNIFSIEDDKALGAQFDAEISSDPATYPILSPATYADAYQYIYDIRDRILDAGQVRYKDEFEWQVKIIRDDNILNAFCTPGGYIYVYTGLIKYLDNEAQLAGVLGHEIAHADLRHVTDQLTEQYGISLLLSLVLGQNQNVLSDIAVGLASLAFSRGDESQADEYSVNYLCSNLYTAYGAAGFFEKIEAEGGATIPEFLSTHPSPENRIEDIYAHFDELGCEGDEIYVDRYQDLKDALP